MTDKNTAKRGKVTLSLIEKEEQMMRLILKTHGFSRPTDFFRHILHKYYEDIIDLQSQVEILNQKFR